jgi:hypothetical protein
LESFSFELSSFSLVSKAFTFYESSFSCVARYISSSFYGRSDFKYLTFVGLYGKKSIQVVEEEELPPAQQNGCARTLEACCVNDNDQPRGVGLCSPAVHHHYPELLKSTEMIARYHFLDMRDCQTWL